ncbi:hypothetical protein [Roseobacter sp. S98]|uniref:hypothetical protein n=1 Tax=Roseobacter algicola (ex Choi et al. 2025) (nom. illeg.) TaxID=3092138 RepID=UPI0035C66D6E
MMAKIKASEIRKWSDQQKRLLHEVLLESVVEVTTVAQDGVPEVTGRLKNSLVVELNGKRVGEGRDAYEAAIRSAKTGDTITVGWTAPYAVGVEGGFTQTVSGGRTINRPGRFFMQRALMEWPEILRKIAKQRGAL